MSVFLPVRTLGNPLKAILRPSGDHAGAVSLIAESVKRTWLEPSAFMTYSSARASRCDLKAILAPSGDQLGSVLTVQPGPFVRRASPLPSAFTTKMSWQAPASLVKASRAPSGDHPPYRALRTTSRGSLPFGLTA